MLKDFKAFILRGNVVDLAVAVVIGAAFGAVVTSFVHEPAHSVVSHPGQALIRQPHRSPCTAASSTTGRS